MVGMAGPVPEPGWTGHRYRGAGFTYLGVMFLIALMAITATAATSVWRIEQQRESEAELLFRGRQFKVAIQQYARRGQGAAYPMSFAVLLADPRSLATVRDLRKLYLDPFSHQPRWGAMLDSNGAILGVYSLSKAKPLKTIGFELDEPFSSAKTYREWRFLAKGTAARVRRFVIADFDKKDYVTDPDAPGHFNPLGTPATGPDAEGADELAAPGPSSSDAPPAAETNGGQGQRRTHR